MTTLREILDANRVNDDLENTFIIYTGESTDGLTKYGYYENELDEGVLGSHFSELPVTVWDNNGELREIDEKDCIPCMSFEESVKKAEEMGYRFERQATSTEANIRDKDGRWLCFKSELPKYFAMQGGVM